MPDSPVYEVDLSPVIRSSDSGSQSDPNLVGTHIVVDTGGTDPNISGSHAADSGSVADVIFTIDRTVVELIQTIDSDYYAAIDKAHLEGWRQGSNDENGEGGSRLVERPSTPFTENEAKQTKDVLDKLSSFFGADALKRRLLRRVDEKIYYATSAAKAWARKKVATAFNDGINKVRSTSYYTGVEAAVKQKIDDWVPKSLIKPSGKGREQRDKDGTNSSVRNRLTGDQDASNQNQFNSGVSPSMGNDWLWGVNHPAITSNKELNFEPGPVKPSDPIMTRVPMPFYFVDVRTDNHCFFNATISDLSDSYSPNWTRESYFGRTEGISKYVNTDRTISVNFTIIADDADDLESIYKKLNWLAQAVYPKYKENSAAYGYESSPILRMRIGDLIKYNSTGIGGYLTTLDYAYSMDAGWEVTTVGKKVPKKIDVSMAFTVIHDFMPDFGSTFYDVKAVN